MNSPNPEQSTPWSIQQTERGYQLYYKDEPWIGDPRPTREEAEEYLARLKDRYDSVDFFLGDE